MWLGEIFSFKEMGNGGNAIFPPFRGGKWEMGNEWEMGGNVSDCRNRRKIE